jgi:hypothetical protein
MMQGLELMGNYEIVLAIHWKNLWFEVFKEAIWNHYVGKKITKKS